VAKQSAIDPELLVKQLAGEFGANSTGMGYHPQTSTSATATRWADREQGRRAAVSPH
jgi:hypothetical protein